MSDIEVLDAVPRHGGARPNSGPKKGGWKKSEEAVDFDKAKARHELAKAESAEIDLLVKKGEWVSREAVRQATATAYASLAQTLRSIPDLLERNLGIAPELAEDIGRQIDECLNGVATEFELMGGADVG